MTNGSQIQNLLCAMHKDIVKKEENGKILNIYHTKTIYKFKMHI